MTHKKEYYMTHKNTKNNTKHKLIHTNYTYSKTHNDTQYYNTVHNDTKWHTNKTTNTHWNIPKRNDTHTYPHDDTQLISHKIVYNYSQNGIHKFTNSMTHMK